MESGFAGLTGFDHPVRAVVIGAGGGIGSAVTRLLLADPGVAEVLAFARRPLDPASALGPKLRPGILDVTDEDSIARAAEAAGSVDLVFVATGLLHGDGVQPEKSWRSLDPQAMATLFQVNAIGPALVAKHFLARLPRRGRSVFAAISAKVGSIGDNRLGGWYGYRAAKAALNQIIRTASIELARTRPDALCVALHPGTVDTGLSKPFQAGVADGKLFPPEISAAHLLTVLNGLTPADSGGLFAWNGERLPY
ncbi:SDR family NAD(P)-dependent oxidoreductase [Azospirillum rugosum]|uniref:NAD(P)-dependent dehydrogenase (Short-subunit alcohol dehydrogenase family) n=1 Tax=Azospirillum rugosum TaxID=416170 RepID=A0ABS4SG96_9PROT|nr:SDR family NAD(P)-dependent oxidoreductase [Azospirillum rugosum]MBP2291522.1 NAD(P)-dependent dehydrogenase (short-subunit alcohol dehydrogenase family) [Azospirillum rugosum]MDQ0525310.1 NAD(P)-dependent dehydrogenase (short-subunit alcohol dehydrogenase family) [Azospirillum rugosum]